jgi:hypothetical protein
MIQMDGYNLQVVASSPASIDGAVPLLRDIAEKASVLVGS